MVTTNAILIAATIFLIAFLGVFGIVAHHGFRFLRTVAILKAAPDAKAAAAMMRADGGNETPQKPEKQPMEMPATGIDELSNSKEAIANLRKKQDPTPDPY